MPTTRDLCLLIPGFLAMGYIVLYKLEFPGLGTLSTDSALGVEKELKSFEEGLSNTIKEQKSAIDKLQLALESKQEGLSNTMKEQKSAIDKLQFALESKVNTGTDQHNTDSKREEELKAILAEQQKVIGDQKELIIELTKGQKQQMEQLAAYFDVIKKSNEEATAAPVVVSLDTSQVTKVWGVQAPLVCTAIKKGPGAQKEGEIANIAYWKDVPRDMGGMPKHHYSSNPTEEKYLTFERDDPGWNNMRMAFESCVAFAVATGRTLVIPYQTHDTYSLKEGPKGIFSYIDVYDLDQIKKSGRIKIIMTPEFLEKEAIPGNLGVKLPKAIKDMTEADVTEYYRSVAIKLGTLIKENTSDKAFLFPLEQGEKISLEDDRYKNNKGVQDFLADRTMMEYTEDMAKAKVVHLKATVGEPERLLLQFYNFVHMADPAEDNYLKRFIRDVMHYRDDLYCKASQIITQVQADARKLGSPDGKFHTFHVRRNDFGRQYPQQILPAEELLEASMDWLKQGDVVYVSTDEKNSLYFDPLRQRYKLLFLDNYWKDTCGGEVHGKYSGILDTILASYGETFCGTYLSTMTGYILRLRGYQNKPSDSNWYFTKPHRTIYQREQRPSKPFWIQEWWAGYYKIDDE